MFSYLFVCWKDFSTVRYSFSRGAGADLPIQSNEAMASQWKGGLINHLYLLQHGHDESDVQTLVTRVSFLGFCFKLLVPTH